MDWLIPCRVTLDGTAFVSADNAEDAIAKFNKGDFHFEYSSASMADWDARGNPEGNG